MRVFVAVKVPEELETPLRELQDELRGCGISMRWTRTHNLHFTLQFVGEQDEDTVEKLRPVLQQVAAEHEPFELELGNLGGFPNPNAARVAWVGVSEGAHSLVKLASDTRQGIDSLDLNIDRKKFKPHLTIGRAKRGKTVRLDVPPALQNIRIGRMSVRNITLVRSQLQPSGPVYTDLLTCALGAENGM